jgi:hypothetical protein
MFRIYNFSKYWWFKWKNKKEQSLLYGDSCTPMFMAVLFTVIKVWHQPRCPSTDELIEKMWYIYTMKYYSDIKNNEIISFAGK